MTTRNDEDTTPPPQKTRGGQELPDEVQDRPEQNAGYDAAVRGKSDPTSPASDMDVDFANLDLEANGSGRAESVPPDWDDRITAPESAVSEETRLAAIDDEAERAAIADVRWREREQR